MRKPEYATAKGDVRVEYGSRQKFAPDRRITDSNSGDVIAKQDVTFVKAGVIYKGENIDLQSLKTEQDPRQRGVAAPWLTAKGTLFYTLDDLETETKYVERTSTARTLTSPPTTWPTRTIAFAPRKSRSTRMTAW